MSLRDPAFNYFGFTPRSAVAVLYGRSNLNFLEEGSRRGLNSPNFNLVYFYTQFSDGFDKSYDVVVCLTS